MSGERVERQLPRTRPIRPREIFLKAMRLRWMEGGGNQQANGFDSLKWAERHRKYLLWKALEKNSEEGGELNKAHVLLLLRVLLLSLRGFYPLEGWKWCYPCAISLMMGNGRWTV
ncbi:hypothetical protein SORBI_3006G201450 [Sorghum bicolor]|uniref:Uncharacterized protein n=1 Tax=Sorghum bicolor TaxID=4558 RepID=A0A1Z5REW5_SORBI|nr:hypothetical protein SORBI_3006G201450 [Sorghum bicolor]